MTNEMVKLHRWLTERLSELYEESQCEVPKLPKKIVEGEILSIKETLSFIDEMDRDSLQEEPETIPNIDDILEEKGIDLFSKEAKILKESYYMALDKFKAQKGEEV